MHLIWHSRRGCRRNHLWQIFWWSVEGCRFCGGSKIALSHWQSQWPLTQGWRYRAACDPHMPTDKVRYIRLLFVFVCLCVRLSVCLFVRLLISPPRINLAASNFARRFIGVQGRESPILWTLSPRSQNRKNPPAQKPRPPACKHYRRDVPMQKRHATDVPFVKSCGV